MRKNEVDCNPVMSYNKRVTALRLRLFIARFSSLRYHQIEPNSEAAASAVTSLAIGLDWAFFIHQRENRVQLASIDAVFGGAI